MAEQKWRSRTDDSIVVDLINRDADNATYRDRNGPQTLPIEDFDKTFEPVLPAVRLAGPSMPTSAPSRAAPDGGIIPAQPAPERPGASSALMSAVGGLIDEVRFMRGELRFVRDQLSSLMSIVGPQPAKTEPAKTEPTKNEPSKTEETTKTDPSSIG
jgi:hypothetical protein